MSLTTPILSARRWPEHDMIEREYPRKGRHWIAKQLGRSPDVIHAYARRHGLELGDLPGHIRISELARLLNLEPGIIHQRADHDRVTRRLRAATPHRNVIAAVVPREWADAYTEEITARLRGQELRDQEGWLTTPELVELWKVGKGTILRGLNGRGALAPLLEGARTARGMEGASGGAWLLHPDDARAVREKLDADRERAKALVSTKSIAVELGVKQGYAATIGRDLGGELLFVHGRHMCHVTPDTAEYMRQRFRENKGLTPRTFRARKPTPPKRCAVCGELFERRQAPVGEPGYESPGMFEQRLTCGPACHQERSRATRAQRRKEATP